MTPEDQAELNQLIVQYVGVRQHPPAVPKVPKHVATPQEIVHQKLVDFFAGLRKKDAKKAAKLAKQQKIAGLKLTLHRFGAVEQTPRHGKLVGHFSAAELTAFNAWLEGLAAAMAAFFDQANAVAELVPNYISGLDHPDEGTVAPDTVGDAIGLLLSTRATASGFFFDQPSITFTPFHGGHRSK